MRKYTITVGDETFTISVKNFSSERADLEIDGKEISIRVDGIESDSGGGRPVRRKPTASSEGAPAPAVSPMGQVTASGAPGTLIAPIPGQIQEIYVSEGDEVTSGQPVLKMEAMKMENVIHAHVSGTVGSISVSAGDAVGQGDELMVIA